MTDERSDGRTDGRMDGRTNGQTDGRTDRRTDTPSDIAARTRGVKKIDITRLRKSYGEKRNNKRIKRNE